jgi:aminomuconate-semialdehyde/2-hydroxymuconate-6-semialdehyde dehydrogenase
LRIGDPAEETTDVGALVSEAHRAKVESYIPIAQAEGGTILTGGRRPTKLAPHLANGFYFEPTVIAGLGISCRTLQEEIFGPVVTITPFDGEEEAIAFANSTRYGLSASLWTRDLRRAHRVASRIDSGTVWVNCWLLRDLRVPFGGAKDSGVGREGGFESLQFFTEAKNVCVKL